jgi:hypothetical protein
MSKTFALCIVLAELTGAAVLSAARLGKEYRYRWQDYSSGMKECGFDTIEQCVATISGSGGSCVAIVTWSR